MPLDIGYVGVSTSDGIDIKVYYQTGFAPADGETYMDAPLVNGPRGYCLDVTNTTGGLHRVSVATGSGDLARNVLVPQGDPVTTGAARSRTANVLHNAGFLTRGDVAELTIQ